MTIIDNAVYKNGRRILAPTSLDQTWRALKESGDLAWLGMYRPDAHELQEVADELHLHELAVEDALSGGQRAKLEHYGEDWFMVLHPARYIDETETVEFGEIGVFSGDDYVVTVRHAEEPDLAAVRHSLERDSPDRLALGPWQVTFEILDKVVDDYFPVADGLEQDIGEIEDQIFAGDAHVSRRIYELSREVLNFQHAIRALPTMVDQLQDDARARLHADEAGESSAASQGAAIEVENLRRLRDVHDHAVQINERVAAMRAMLNSALELDSTLASKRLAEQSIEQNEQVKRISSWAAIIFAPQLVGSIYGMNFDRMPELHWTFGYPFALALMLTVAVVLWVLFKRAEWL
ncbi:magnesium and cobalt transport protein CorA [Micrococcus lylae]|uniref:magnesium and cobalt transport protein CorA n=1 Tax=Micrococcus TaxID=1269 RepID=UPI00187D4925|nr:MULTISPECIES: magnesium and cobalt transport protein CorA [Micrococcus]MCT2006983.1 magnesium and cobalt transport protein CorA [Micrococcus lylae]MCT2071175.1 magnesium and cobalt transport protein CorA [Micrococcus lylae]